MKYQTTNNNDYTINTPTYEMMEDYINDLVDISHGSSLAAGWYNNPKTKEPIKRNVPEMLCLIHSEISEAMEGYRKNLQDDKLPDKKMIMVELADALIRIFDIAGYLQTLPGYEKENLGEAFAHKFLYNQIREDHKIEHRAKEGGKAF